MCPSQPQAESMAAASQERGETEAVDDEVLELGFRGGGVGVRAVDQDGF